MNIGYIRRSSNEKKKANYSIESQTTVIEELARQNGEQIDKWFIDEGYSGTTLKRPNMQKMLKDFPLIKEEIHLYAWISSRISRNTSDTQSLRFVFEKYDVKVITLDDNWVTFDEMKNNPDKAFSKKMINSVDENEVARDRYRTMQGLKTSAIQNRNYCKGGKNVQTGYIAVPNKNGKGRKIEIDYKYVDTILYLLSQVHDFHRTIDSLAIELNAKKACGVSWSFSKIYNFLTDHIIYGRFLTSYADVRNHSPAWCSEKYFNEIQEVLNSRRKETKHKYLFKNLIQCECCNTWCIEIPTIHYPRTSNEKRRKREKKIYKYYVCPKCQNRINENKLLEKISLDMDKMVNEENDNQTYQTYEEAKKRERRITNSIELISQEYEDGLISLEQYKEERKKFLAKRKKISSELKQLEKERKSGFLSFTFYQKKEFLRKSVMCIQVDLKKKEIKEIKKMEKYNYL